MRQLGIADEEFIRGKVPMTKAEIRAMVMVKAAVAETDIVCDVGAGTGSLSVEAALCASKGHVYAIERNPEGIALISQNAKKFDCDNITIIEGVAPSAMETLPALDVVLIGGSGGNLSSILDAADTRLSPGGRIVITAVTVETTEEVVREMSKRNYAVDGFQMQVNRLRCLGHYHLYDPQSPVFIFTCVKA